MKKIRLFAAGAVLVFVCFEASGQTSSDSTAQVIRSQAPKGITSAFYACIEKAESNSMALGACEAAEKKVQDGRLNAVYKSVLGKLNGQKREDLIIAQRAWLDFHQKTERVEFSLYGGDSDAVSRSESGFEIDLRALFRLGERANTLQTYLFLADD